MSLPIRVLPQADDDLEEIAVYIAAGSVDAAMRFLDAAQSTISSLLERPPSRGIAPHSERTPLWRSMGAGCWVQHLHGVLFGRYRGACDPGAAWCPRSTSTLR